MDPGARIGDYTVERLLGRGGMGDVHLATAPDGTQVAIKLVRPELANDETYLRRFAREARAASRIASPHVVAVVDAGEHEGQPYIVQEFIAGGSLEDRLRRDGRLDVETIVRLCTDVAGGLEALHEHDIIHRDVKPGNILLDTDGSARITDFGLAKDWAASMLTRPGQAIGSLDYMAPEQITGEDVTGRTDVYALGCVVFECLSGRPPFADRTGAKVMFAHLRDPPPDPLADRDDAPAELGGAVLTALEKDPEERPESPSAYADALRAAARLD